MRRLSGVTVTPCFLSVAISLSKRLRIDHHAIADDRQLAAAHHAGRQQRQFVGLAVDDQRVAGIVAALEAHDDVGLLGQPVDDLALALVAPLGADHHDIRHQRLLPAPVPGHWQPGVTGQVHLRIKDAPGGGKALAGRPAIGNAATVLILRQFF